MKKKIDGKIGTDEKGKEIYCRKSRLPKHSLTISNWIKQSLINSILSGIGFS